MIDTLIKSGVKALAKGSKRSRPKPKLNAKRDLAKMSYDLGKGSTKGTAGGLAAGVTAAHVFQSDASKQQMRDARKPGGQAIPLMDLISGVDDWGANRNLARQDHRHLDFSNGSHSHGSHGLHRHR